MASQRTRVGGSWARTGLPAALTSATYNAANHQLTFGGASLTYDLNGNLTGDGTNTYTWSARNQLASLTGPIAGSFVYDAMGRRQRKTIDGTITDFVYDGLNPVREAVGANTINLLTGLGIDEYFTRTDSSSTRNLLTDALGSTVSLADSSGTVQTEYSYEPFGTATASGSTSVNELRYTGREEDGTGLNYYRARYYHPNLQRFISEDPIGFAGGDPNLYAYVGNSPLSFRDPSGHNAIVVPVVVGGAVIVALWLASDQGRQAVRDTIEGAQQLAETTIDTLQSLMGRRQRESGLENLSDEEIARRARDKSLPTEERLRYVREEKNRKMRNKGKDRGGPVRPMGFIGLELAPPWEAVELDGPVPLSGRKR